MLVIIAIATEHSLISLQNWFIASLGTEKKHLSYNIRSSQTMDLQYICTVYTYAQSGLLAGEICQWPLLWNTFLLSSTDDQNSTTYTQRILTLIPAGDVISGLNCF
jgi:hypothetical protein